MSRITGSEARGMIEAYAAVYAPQEQVEEVVEEQVEELDEQDVRALRANAEREQQQKRDKQSEIEFKAGGGQAALGLARSRRENLSRDEVIRRGQTALKGAKPSEKPTDKPSGSRFARPRNAAPGISDIRGGKGSVTPTRTPAAPQPPARPAAAPAPAAAKTAPTRPAAPAKPATGMLGKTSFERRTPTSAELKAAQAARAGGANPEQALRAAKAAGTASKVQSAGQAAGAKAFSSPTAGASAFKPATSAPEVKQTAAIASTPKPTPVAPRQTAREKVLNQSYEYDAYDLVLEYLLNNGHVETVDEAHYVMLEMEAEVIRDIVEETRRTEYLQKKFNKENKRKSGSAHTAIPGKQNTGQALQKARESERHMSGDK
jgi:hypothetical protein